MEILVKAQKEPKYPTLKFLKNANADVIKRFQYTIVDEVTELVPGQP